MRSSRTVAPTLAAAPPDDAAAAAPEAPRTRPRPRPRPRPLSPIGVKFAGAAMPGVRARGEAEVPRATVAVAAAGDVARRLPATLRRDTMLPLATDATPAFRVSDDARPPSETAAAAANPAVPPRTALQLDSLAAGAMAARSCITEQAVRRGGRVTRSKLRHGVGRGCARVHPTATSTSRKSGIHIHKRVKPHAPARCCCGHSPAR